MRIQVQVTTSPGLSNVNARMRMRWQSTMSRTPRFASEQYFLSSLVPGGIHFFDSCGGFLSFIPIVVICVAESVGDGGLQNFLYMCSTRLLLSMCFKTNYDYFEGLG